MDEIAEESLREALGENSWQDLLARGRRRGAASGITEEQVPEVVSDYRKQHLGQ